MTKRFFFRKSAVSGLAALLFASVPLSSFAEDAAVVVVPPKIELQAVVKNGPDLDLYLKNRPEDPLDLKIYDSDKLLTNYVTYLNGGVVRVLGVSKSWTSISAERWGNQTSTDGVRSKVAESKTSAITSALPETTYLKNGVRREIMREIPVYVIPVQFEKNFSDLVFSWTPKNDNVLRTQYSVSIGTGPNLPIQTDDGFSPFEAQRAYVTTAGIILREQTLPEELNRVTLKADGVPLNWVTVKKQTEILGSLLETAIDTSGSEPQIVLRFQNSRSINDLSLYDFQLNGQIIVPEIEVGTGTKSTVSTGFGASGPITLRIRPSLLGTSETAARIVAKEKSSSLFDSRTVDLSALLMPNIDSVTATPSGAATNFKVNINPVSLFGDYEKFTITLNGTGYTARGVKNTLKNADGTVKTDMYGNEAYEFLNKLEFRKTMAGLEFSFPSDRLKASGNTIKIGNGNSQRESVELVFSPGIPAGPETASGKTVKETVAFKPTVEQPGPADPVASSSRDVTFGNFSVSDLDPTEYYRFSGKLLVSKAYNPFSRATASSLNVTESMDDGLTALEFSEEGLGSTLVKDVPFTVGLGDFLADGTSVPLEWKSVKLEKTNGYGWKTVSELTGPKGSYAHKVTWGKCSDGSATLCGKDGLPEESSTTFAFNFNGAVSTVSTPATTTTVTTPTTGTVSNGKKNDPWKLSATAGNGQIGKLLDSKLGAAFAKVKDKYANDPKKRSKLTAAKKAVEQSLRTGKKYEEAKAKAMKNMLKKTLVRDLKDALKKLGEVSK